MATFQKSEQLIQKTQKPIGLIIYTAHETFLPLRHAPCFVFYTPTNSVLKHRASHMYRVNSLKQTVSDPLTTQKSDLNWKTPKFTANKKCMCNKLVPVLIQLSKAHSYWLKVIDEGIEAIKTTIRQL